MIFKNFFHTKIAYLREGSCEICWWYYQPCWKYTVCVWLFMIFINNFGIGIDFILIYLSICPTNLFNNCKTTSPTNSLALSKISLNLSLSISFDEFSKFSFTIVFFFHNHRSIDFIIGNNCLVNMLQVV